MLHLSTRQVAAFGFPFRFESDDQALVALVEWCYADLPSAPGPGSVLRAARLKGRRTAAVGFEVTLWHPDGSYEFCGSGRDGGALLEQIWWEVNKRALQSAANSLVLHAASFGGPQGAVVLVGASHAGKSTLAAAAAMRGLRHLSDDLVIVDPVALTVAPYARPIMLRPGGRALLAPLPAPPAGGEYFGEEWFLPASALGAMVVATPQPLVGVGLLERADHAGLEPVESATALHAMALQCATLVARGAPAFSELESIARRAHTFRLLQGAPADALDLVTPLIGGA